MMLCVPCDTPALAAAPRTTTSPAEADALDDDDDDGGDVCRICFDGAGEEALIAPCACDGPQRFVHLSCLRRWQRAAMSRARRRLVVSGRDATAHERCGRCRAPFDREAVPALPRSRVRCCPAVRRGARCVGARARPRARARRSSLSRVCVLVLSRQDDEGECIPECVRAQQEDVARKRARKLV